MIIEFDEPFGGCTHAQVDSQTRVESAMVRLDVTYGDMDGEDFVPSPLQGPALMLNGLDMEDFIEEVKKAPGRPADKPDHEYLFKDVADYYKTPRAVKRDRIEARRQARVDAEAEINAEIQKAMDGESA